MHQRDTKAIVVSESCQCHQTGQRVGFLQCGQGELRHRVMPGTADPGHQLSGRTREGIGPGQQTGAFFGEPPHISMSTLATNEKKSH